MLTLTIEQRDTAQSLTKLRNDGKIPGVLYGRKEPATSIFVNKKDFEKLWHAAGESTVIELAGVGDTKQALIHEVSANPVTDTIEHVDFYVVEKGMKVTTHVPLVFVGEAPAVKNLGGTVVKVLHEIEVEALPKDLPHEIEIDISKLETFDSRIAIKDVKVAHGVTIMTDPEETIAAVSQPKEEEEEPATAIDMESIEVEQKGKKEEEEVPPGDAE